MVLALGFISCEKEIQTNNAEELELKSGPDDPQVINWDMCCNPPYCLGEEFNGSLGWSFSVYFNSFVSSHLNLANYYMYVRPHGTNQPYSLVGQASNGSNPVLFDLGIMMNYGCYDVRFANFPDNDPKDELDEGLKIDFTFCCEEFTD